MKDVYPITVGQSENWILKKHYAKRMPSINFAFGLYINKVIEGVITYGLSPSPTISSSICGEEYSKDVMELNRIVINSKVPKNSASFLVSNSLKLLPKKKWIIVSFADSNIGHTGYIYQATNFLYTGLSSNQEALVDVKGNDFHFRKLGHIRKKIDINKINKKYWIKERTNLNQINVLEVCKYLKHYKEKSGYTTKQIDSMMGYKYASGHWFRTDDGKSLPTVDDWIRLKEIIKFDDRYDDLLNKFKYVYDRKEHIKMLGLKNIKQKGKHRYIYFLGKKKEVKIMKKKLLLKILPYPKDKSKRYDCIDIKDKQKLLCEGSIKRDISDFQSEGVGAIPTPRTTERK